MTRLKVMYIDDEADLCQVFVDYFESAEVEVKTYTDPDLALAEIERDTPDLLFLDFRLPGTTGLEIAAKIKKPCKMAMITGDLSVEVSSQFLKVFHKPYEISELEAFIHSFRSSNKASRAS